MQPWHGRLPFAALPVGSDSWAAQKRDLIHQETKFHFNPSVENEHGIPGPVWVHFPTQPPIQEELKPCASHHRNAIFSLFSPPKTGLQPKSVAAVGFLSPSCARPGEDFQGGGGMEPLARQVSAPR